jgi:hypothetical protein
MTAAMKGKDIPFHQGQPAVYTVPSNVFAIAIINSGGTGGITTTITTPKICN